MDLKPLGAVFALLLLSLPCSAQLHIQPIEPVDFTRSLRKVRVLPPSGAKTDAPSLTVSYANRFPDNFQRSGASYGAGGGAEVEFPMNNKGTAFVAGVSGVDSYKVYEEDGLWKQDRVRSFPVTVGVLQKIGRIGWGDALGERGFFLEPQVGAGVGVAGVTTFAGPTKDPEPYSNGKIETRQAVLPMPYVSSGIRAQAYKGIALGLEARHYQVIGAADGAHGGTYVFATLTATPKLTKRLRKTR